MTDDALKKDSPSGVLRRQAVPDVELDGWGMGPRASRGMTPDDALPSQVSSTAIELPEDEASFWEVVCGIEPPDSDWLIEQDYLVNRDKNIRAAVDLEAFYRFRQVLRAAPADIDQKAELSIDARTALILARILLKKLT